MANEIGFVVDQTALTSAQATVIQANFDEMKKYLTEMMESYKTLSISPDDIQAAKAIQARIGKVKDRIEEQRKTVKKMWGVPLAEFEKRCKELTAECDEATSNIKGQLAEYEEQRKQEKGYELSNFFDGCVAESPEVEAYLKWSDIFDTRWLNVTYSIGKAKMEISNAVGKCAEELRQIRSIKSRYETALLDVYKSTHNLALVMQKQIEYANRDAEQRRKELEEQAAEKEKEAHRQETEDAEQVQAQETAPVDPEKTAAKIYRLSFRVTGTREQLMELSSYMKNAGISYERI